MYDRLQSITQLCLTDYRWGKVYAPNNQTLAQVGDIIKREDLANTLEIIANNGSADRACCLWPGPRAVPFALV